MTTDVETPPAPPVPPEADAPGRHVSGDPAPAPAKVRRRRRLTPTGAVVVWAALALGLLAVWLVTFAVVLSGVQESRSQKLAYDQLRERLAAATAPLGGVIAPGTPVAVLDAPSVGLSSVVVEGTSAMDLEEGPGHRRDTVLPGQAGVSVLYGRSVMFGAPFAKAPLLAAGATIKVTTGQGEFTYVVDRVRHPGDPVPAPLAAGKGRLVLVTSQGEGWRARLAPPTTVFVDATLSGEAQPTKAGRPAGVPEAERPMGHDSASLLALMLWLQLFVIASVALVWAWYRWGRWQTWLVGLPVLLAVLWGVAENAVAFLPNLI
jgi:sortase A